MDERTTAVDFDPRLLYDAARTLHGYYLYRVLRDFLGVVLRNVQDWWRQGLLGPDHRPTDAFRRYPLTFRALDLSGLAYVCGNYFFVYAGHKTANGCLRHDTRKRVLYLRGFDYEAALRATEDVAVGMSTVDTSRFTSELGSALGSEFDVFRALSPRELDVETATLDRSFYADYERIVRASSAPFRSVYLNARYWQHDIAHLADRVDYFVVYVSSKSSSVCWELDYLKTRGYEGRTTVVFDRAAILNKTRHTHMHERLHEEREQDVVWSPSGSAVTEAEVDGFRAELAETFTVISADAFQENVGALLRRIREASGPLSPGTRESPLAFRFVPALGDDELRTVRSLDAALWQDIDPEDTRIDCLPFYVNQMLLRVFTSLALGDHGGAGRTLAAYAGIMDVLSEECAKAGSPALVAEQGDPECLPALKDHRDTARTIACAFLAAGSTVEFDEHVEAATATSERYERAARSRAAEWMRSVRDARHPDRVVR